MKVISIDPSIHNLGIAVANTDRVITEATLIRSSKDQSANWQSAALTMSEAVSLIITTAIADDPEGYILVSEMPENWFGERGEDSKNSEAVQKLYFYVGYQMSLLRRQYPSIKMFLVTPTVWKGQTPKTITLKRAVALLAKQGVSLKVLDLNVSDAIMIGQFAYDNFHRLIPIESFIQPINTTSYI